MELIDHTLAWCRGEIFEGRLYFLFGLVILLVTLAYWRYGSTPAARGIIIPLAVVAVISIAGGTVLNVSNQSRILAYQEAYVENPKAFIQKEKTRTEAFMKWYPYTMFSMAGIVMIGLALFLFRASPHWKGIGLGVVLFGFSILFLDHFSEERANTYYQIIIERMAK